MAPDFFNDWPLKSQLYIANMSSLIHSVAVAYRQAAVIDDKKCTKMRL